MSFRHLGMLFALLVLVSLSFTPSAHAQDCEHACYENLDDGFNGWENLDPYGSGPLQPPSTTQCVAKASRNQGCRGCATQYDPNGQPTGSFICVFITQSG